MRFNPAPANALPTETFKQNQKLKSSGRKLEEVVAAKPTAQHDAAWGKGFLTPEQYVAFVYNTL